jgi:magnesium-dependent phosphatase 1
MLFGRQWRRLPKVIVFDVDYTLWPYWVDTHVRAPFSKAASGEITDANGKQCVLFPDVEQIMLEIHRHPDIQIGLASRTGEPSWLQSLASLHVFATPEEEPELSLWTVAQYREVYTGSKLTHFANISQKSGIDCSEMLFFDDEPENNREVTQLGVHFVAVPSFSSTGTTLDLMIQGLEEFEQGGAN